MKTSGSSAGVEAGTPPTKKLKQARLPFQVITPEAVKPQETKKRKLSEEREEAPTKIVKKSLEKSQEFEKSVENDEPQIISDDDEKTVENDDKKEETTSPKPINPFVSIVDIALKRKMKKKKSPPTKKTRESRSRTKKTNKAQDKCESQDEEKTDEVKEVESVKDNKENLSSVILIDDSNDCDIRHKGNSKSGEETLSVSDKEEQVTSEKYVNGETKEPESDHVVEIVDENEEKEVENFKQKSEKNIRKAAKGKQKNEQKEQKKSERKVGKAEKNKKKDENKEMDEIEKDENKAEKVEQKTIKDYQNVKKNEQKLEKDEKMADKAEQKAKKEEQNVEKDEKTANNVEQKTEENEQKVEKEEQKSENDESKTENNCEEPMSIDEQQKSESESEQKSEVESSTSDDEENAAETSIMDTSCDVSMCEDVSDDAGKKGTPEKKTGNKDLLTPKSNRKPQQVNGSPHTPVEIKKLTPKQLQKKMESAKKQQEREKERLERLKKKQEEKDERNRQRLEKEEQKRKEREEKEEQKRKEREEKEKQKELEKKEREEKEEAKRKEREEKELQKKREKEAKEEERKKKELEREEDKRKKEMEKEEAEIKKKKAAAAFVNFFVPKASGSKETDVMEPAIKHDYLSNFTKKADMRLAPIIRRKLKEEEKSHLDECLLKQDAGKGDMFVRQVKRNDYEVGCSLRTWPLEEEDVMIVDELPIDSVDFIPEESHKEKMRAKLLSFSENRRPPYWGTWRRRSKHITGRRPFGMDSNMLDYECDSDDEWEEEEPGESVGGSVAGSDDEEDDNDYDVDNDFLVPHGYLSEEEAMGEEDEILSPESQKAKLKIMQCEFEKEMKKNVDKLHPRSIGIIWQNSTGGKPETCKDSLWDFLVNKRILTEEDHIVIQPKPIVVDSIPEETKNDKQMKKSRKISEDMTSDLIRLVHGNTNNRGFLAHEFQTYLAKTHQEQNPDENVENYIHVSKMSIAKKIKEISKWMSCPIEGAMFGKMCWCVSNDVLEKHETKAELPNKWNYVLKHKKRNSGAQITQFLNADQANT